MRCKSCGGEIKLENGLAICLSCGNKYEFAQAFESVDVFICYVENDLQGRRTKDSMIAQNIYNKLESAKINSFYERVSISSLAGDAFEKAYHSAISSAKILIVLGTEPKHFTMMLEKNKDFFGDKKIFPVYSSMNPYDIPKELSKFQALNYDSVGAISDLTKNVLTVLGRENEVDIVKLTDKTKKKRKRIILTSLALVFLIIIGAASYIVFGTTYVLDSKKYSYAQDLMGRGEYVEAIDMFLKLDGYQNSDNLLKSIYDKYNGYYQNDDGAISLRINVEGGLKAAIEITKSDEDGKIVRIIETAEINKNIILFAFNDSQNNQGNATIELQNSGINLTITTEVAVSEVSIGNLDVYFKLSEKSDKPFVKEITQEVLLGWLSQRTTMSTIKQMGYELIHLGALYKDTSASLYEIKDTDIKLALFNYDIYDNSERYGDEKTSEEDRILVGISAPAKILLPDKIKADALPFVEDDILYVPDGHLAANYRPFDFGVTYTGENITETTIIGATSKNKIGNEYWHELVNETIIFYLLEKTSKICVDAYGLKTETGGVWVNIESESDTHFLFSVNLKNLTNKGDISAYYKVNKNNGYVQFVSEDSNLVFPSDINDSHDDLDMETPNVWCPSCGNAFFIVGIEGFTCSECGHNWLP